MANVTTDDLSLVNLIKQQSVLLLKPPFSDAKNLFHGAVVRELLPGMLMLVAPA